MISRKNRFHGHSGLRFVHLRGKTTRGPFFLLKTAVNPQRSDYRLAIVVSRKASKSAVVRNRIRRRIYAIVRLIEQDITAPHDIILNVFDAKVLEESPKNLTKLVKKQLLAAGVLGKAAARPKKD